jgi:hypothetical protein
MNTGFLKYLRIAFDGEGRSGAGDGDDAAAKAAAEAAAAAEKAAAEKAAADAAAEEARRKAEEAKLSPEDKSLLKDVMKKKERIDALETKLKEFDGINPAEVKKLLAEKKEAEKAKREAEKKMAETAGDVERLKAIMADEHKKELEAAINDHDLTKKEKAKLEKQINDLTVGQAFSNSTFITDNLVLTPTKARAIYGSHFDLQDGAIVAYDKPAGSDERTPLVDSRGKPIGFNDALKKLIDADPERDHILKSKIATGAGSKPGDGKGKSTEESSEISGVSRITAILKKNGIAGASKK